MKTITFYSYKGGVGRTLALKNIAVRLAEYGKKVCILDLDLEAPGIHHKFKEELEDISISNGIVDYIHEYAKNDSVPATILPYTIHMPSTSEGATAIDYIPAGNVKSGEYWRKLSHISWHKLFYEGDREGIYLFADLKGKIERDLTPDYLLIDSRTGLSEISSMPLILMADKVVIVAANNEENLDGSAMIINSLLNKNNQPYGAPPEIVFVLSRVPITEAKGGHRGFSESSEKILIKKSADKLNIPIIEDKDVMIVHSDPNLEIEERTLIGHNYKQNGPVEQDYLNLFIRLMESDLTLKDEAKFKNFTASKSFFIKGLLSEDLEEEINNYSDSVKLNKMHFGSWHNWGVALHNLAISRNNDTSLFEMAIEKYKMATEIQPDYGIAWYNWGVSLFEMAKNSNQDSNFFDLAQAKYNKAIEIQPDYVDAFVALGNLYVEKASIYKQNTFFIKAFEFFKKAIEIQPTDYNTWNNWGIGLCRQAEYQNNNTKLFEKALDKYHKSLEIQPDFLLAMNNLGNCLILLAKAKNNNELLFEEGLSYFQKAIKIKPDDSNAWENWGDALFYWAVLRNNDGLIFHEAAEKYKRATEIQPKSKTAWASWGNTLFELSKSQNNDLSLIKQAEEKYKKAIEIKPDDANFWYNWGVIQFEHFKSSKCDIELLEVAIDKFKQVIKIQPNCIEAWLDWGTALSELGKCRNNDIFILDQAIEKFKKTIQIQPKYLNGWHNLVMGQILISYQKTGSERSKILNEAIENGLIVLQLSNGSVGSYNMACIYSLLDDPKKSLEFLEKALIAKEVNYAHLLNDDDFSSIKATPAFQILLNKFFP